MKTTWLWILGGIAVVSTWFGDNTFLESKIVLYGGLLSMATAFIIDIKPKKEEKNE